MKGVWEPALDHGAPGFLLAMAFHADDEEKSCYPSVSFPAWKAGYWESQVSTTAADNSGRFRNARAH